MRLRILDDDLPGYAQLVFNGSSPLLQKPTLDLSVRSPREKAYLGDDGRWQSAPVYFTATRLGGNAEQATFRVGPEIVNHMLEQDAVEFGTADGALQVETVWENAIPQMADRRNLLLAHPEGAAEGLRGGRGKSGVVVTEPAVEKETPPPQKIEPPAEPVVAKAPEPPPAPPPTPPTPPPVAPPVTPPVTPPPPTVAKPFWTRPVVLGAALIGLLWLAAIVGLIWHFSGSNQPPAQTAKEIEEGVFRAAQLCANGQQRCATPGCYSEYLTKYGSSGSHVLEAKAAADHVAAECAPPPPAVHRCQYVEGEMPIVIGDTYDRVKRAYGTFKSPEPFQNEQTQLRFETLGVWFFFDKQGKIYSIRLDRPWSGSVRGIRVADPKSRVEAKLGQPDNPQDGTSGFARLHYNALGMTLDYVDGRVSSIFVFRC
jgi:hypothetical protein